MSNRNVELMRRFIEAWNSRNVETIIACCDQVIEFHSTFAAVGGAVYYGHEGLRAYQRDMEDAWGDDIHVDPEAYFDLGDWTLGDFMLEGRGKHSGAEIAMPVSAVMRWRDGLMVYFKAYPERIDALSDLGVSGEELEPIDP